MFTDMSGNGDDQETDRRARMRAERDSDQRRVEELATGSGAPWLGAIAVVLIIGFVIYTLTSH